MAFLINQIAQAESFLVPITSKQQQGLLGNVYLTVLFRFVYSVKRMCGEFHCNHTFLLGTTTN